MRAFGSWLLLVVLTSIAFGQGSAAGYGQGGSGGFAGGGMGGGMSGGRMDEAERQPTHPEDDQGADWETRTAILTPGDRVEYKLKVEAGQTLFAGATSDAFDPALSIEDASGKVLAKVDDREEGDQSPFVAVRFPATGTYILKVLSFRSVAGGKFTLKMRTFTSSETPLGKKVHTVAVPDSQRSSQRIQLRIAAAKGMVYDLHDVRSVGRQLFAVSFVRIVGPTGVGANDIEAIANPGDEPVFRAKADGDYYVEFEAYSQRPTVQTDLRKVTLETLKTTDEASMDLQPGELRVFEFPVRPRQIVRTALTGDADYRLRAPVGSVAQEGAGGDPAYGYDPSWTWFYPNLDDRLDVLRIYRAEGTARLAVRGTGAKPGRVVLRNSETVPSWNEGSTEGALAIGESRFFMVRSRKSELMRVLAKSATFQARLDIFDLGGQRVNTLSDRRTHVAADDLYFPEENQYLIRLSCEGHGGSGTYTLRREVPKATPYTLGKPGTIAFDGTNFGLFSVELEVGKRYQLTTDEPQAAIFLRADLLDDDGAFLPSPALAFEKVMVRYFVPTRSGTHRLWLRAPAGTLHFRLEMHVAPTVGG